MLLVLFSQLDFVSDYWLHLYEDLWLLAWSYWTKFYRFVDADIRFEPGRLHLSLGFLGGTWLTQRVTCIFKLYLLILLIRLSWYRVEAIPFHWKSWYLQSSRIYVLCNMVKFCFMSTRVVLSSRLSSKLPEGTWLLVTTWVAITWCNWLCSF